MTGKSSLTSGASPERQFVRATSIVMLVGLILALTSHGALERALSNDRSTEEIARISSVKSMAARSIESTLDRISILPDGPERRTSLNRLGWDVNRLASNGVQLANTLSATHSNLAGLSALIEAAVKEGSSISRTPDVENSRVIKLRQRFQADILPGLDLMALEFRSAAEASREKSQWVLYGSLALYFVTGLCLTILIVRPAKKRIAAWVAETDETDRENRFRLLHDNLTGMPNGAYLHAYISRLAAAEQRNQTQTAVLRIDFDRFKLLKETLGVRACDEVIRIAARRVQKSLRAGDFAAYLGQDDFVVVTAELDDANDAAIIAGRIQNALTKPFSLHGGAKKICCSIGVTLLSDDAADPDLILANAEIALTEAQTEGSGLIRYFSENQRAEVERRETLYTELVTALDNGEIMAFFQPQIDLHDGSFNGFEALVRWQHPQHGLLTPAAFLEFADQVDLTERLGEVVLSSTLKSLQEWDKAGLEVPRVGVNFALAQLRNPRLVEKIKWEVERFDMQPDRVAIEVLETVLIKSDQDMVVRNLRGLASAGFGIELDDFGTGHASISNLRRFMVNRIKIDRSFVFGIETNEEQQQLTASMNAMAKALNIEVLAEGVETEDAELMLRRLGCDYCQGYLIAKPMSFDDTLQWLKSYQIRPYAGSVAEQP